MEGAAITTLVFEDGAGVGAGRVSVFGFSPLGLDEADFAALAAGALAGFAGSGEPDADFASVTGLPRLTLMVVDMALSFKGSVLRQ